MKKFLLGLGVILLASTSVSYACGGGSSSSSDQAVSSQTSFVAKPMYAFANIQLVDSQSLCPSKQQKSKKDGMKKKNNMSKSLIQS